ncbi:MAG TPA: FAD-dependent monooxygenase [Pseudonocardiaceae bacterium]|nr:FAD-dependent monooxygenase [Pseudonocardiaceae bacterium]
MSGVAVVGGSVAGCAAALAVGRAGAGNVTVFERTTGGLRGRGVGLGILRELYRELADADYLDDATPHLPLSTRHWITGDGRSYGGRVVGSQDFPFRSYDWGSLWQGLRDRVPDHIDYRTGCPVVSVADTGPDVVVTLADGTAERFDAVLGADGYRSVVRAALFPDLRPRYAGYLLWRGTLPVADLPPQQGIWAPTEAAGVTFPGGHLMMYLIPGRSGLPVLNWAVYAVPPAELAPRWDDPTSLAPGAIGVDLLDHLATLAERMPPYWRDLLRRMPSEEILAQPIYDLHVPACAVGRIGLVGDAAAVARPHTGGGVAKALQDAVTLESVLREGMAWPDALRAYDGRRGPANRALVEMGRALGRATVLEPPDWRAMTPARFPQWWAEIMTQGELGGTRLR